MAAPATLRLMTAAFPRHAGLHSSRSRTLAAAALPPSRRFFSEDTIADASSRVQVYISRSSNPYLNLSIEHFLLQKSHPDSVVLLLYTNRPCVVIGRNQNPWVEVNLGLLKGSKELLRQYQSPMAGRRGGGVGSENLLPSAVEPTGKGHVPEAQDVELVRRRSGGGTVFHDAGNINWSIICPPAIFDRDKHAEMVVRALRGLPLDRKLDVRVNERHDIVMNIEHEQQPSPSGAAANKAKVASQHSTFKISGSAYKLTRLRSLHHGTLLLSSPNLPVIGQFLRSPAEPYIKARGVESVRSPIRNVGLSNDPGSPFERAVVAEFGKMYDNEEFHATRSSSTGPVPPEPYTPASTTSGRILQPEIITPQAATLLVDSVPSIRKGYDELRSLDWIFAQTPQFTFSTHPTEEDPRPRPEFRSQLGLEDSDEPITAHLTVRQGEVTEAEMNVRHKSTPLGTNDTRPAGAKKEQPTPLIGTKLHEVQDWRYLLGNQPVGSWFNKLFGVNPP